jgi:hypothetical protein
LSRFGRKSLQSSAASALSQFNLQPPFISLLLLHRKIEDEARQGKQEKPSTLVKV